MTAVDLEGSADLLEGAERGDARARFISVDRPTVLLGRRQEPEILDSGAVGKLGWGLVRRMTPGGLVYMDDAAVCLELALPASHRDFTPDVVAATRWFGNFFVRALKELHVEAGLAPANGPPATGLAAQSCFASWVRGEVLVDGRKVFGTAQYRRRGGALFQGVGLVVGSHGRVATVLSGDERARREASAVIDRASASVGAVARAGFQDAIGRADLEQAIQRCVARAGISLG